MFGAARAAADAVDGVGNEAPACRFCCLADAVFGAAEPPLSEEFIQLDFYEFFARVFPEIAVIARS